MNILIVRLSSMGDVIHTLPAMRALRATYPGATLGWAVEDAHSGILRGLSEIDRLFILPRKQLKGGVRSFLRTRSEMRSRLREVDWDLAIDFQGLWKSLAVARWSGAKRVAGYAPSVEKTHWLYTDRIDLPTLDRHAVDRNLDLVSALGASVRHAETRSDFSRDFSLPLQPSDRAAADQALADLNLPAESPKVLLNFSARKPANRWGTSAFAQLADRLIAEGMTPILTGGPDDLTEAEEIQSLAEHPIPSLVARCNLMQISALMKKVDVLVTGDTGPMHIAVAMNLPVIALFGPANPVRTGPYSPDAVVLQKPRECQPCYARHCKFGEEPPLCLVEIGVEEVVNRVRESLGERGYPATAAKVTADPVGESSHTS
jgi:lipopolysaccharide heptosyltransferase I